MRACLCIIYTRIFDYGVYASIVIVRLRFAPLTIVLECLYSDNCVISTFAAVIGHKLRKY